MQSSKTYPGKAMPSYPLFNTSYNEGRNRSTDRPESYPKGVWLDIAAVQQRVSSMQPNQGGHAAASATRPNDIALGSKGGSLHVDTCRAKKGVKLFVGEGTTLVVPFSGGEVFIRMA